MTAPVSEGDGLPGGRRRRLPGGRGELLDLSRAAETEKGSGTREGTSAHHPWNWVHADLQRHAEAFEREKIL